MLINLLNIINITVFGNGFEAAEIKYAFIFHIIEFLINNAGDIGLGIILFTVILRLITLPLDIMSRVSTKKNGLKMESMKPQLEKMQKQYANNKDLYNQKMQALYKKEGYSPFAACLPSIISLVVFFVVFGAFNSFSKYSSKDVINKMAVAYTESVSAKTANNIVVKNSDSYQLNVKFAVTNEGFIELFNCPADEIVTDTSDFTIPLANFLKDGKLDNKLSAAYPELENYFSDGYYNYENTELDKEIFTDLQNYLVLNADKTEAEMISSVIISKDTVDGKDIYVILDYAKFYDANPSLKKYFTVSGENSSVYTLKYKDIITSDSELNNKFDTSSNLYVSDKTVSLICKTYLNNFIYKDARAASKAAYYEYRAHSKYFFWVKNLWVADTSFNPAIQTYSNFVNTISKTSVGSLTEAAYNELIADIPEETVGGFGKGNGYYVLILLSIITMFFSTFVTNKTQKAQMELQTVDGANGQSAMVQKMMMWGMPLMFGVFAFFYSSAFSIYMIVSSLLSTISTLLINFFVELSFKKKIEKQAAESNNRYKKSGR